MGYDMVVIRRGIPVKKTNKHLHMIERRYFYAERLGEGQETE